MAARREPYFTPATFRFLRALKRNNRRDWFHAHKAQYEEHVKAPALRLITDIADPLRTISPQLVASPRAVGGSLFRIHRDTRFSSDKKPYKTHVGLSFYHAATKATARGSLGTAALGRLDAPVLYLHLEPGACFTGGGIWHPQPETLKRLRDFLVDNPRSWKKATRERAFTRVFELGFAMSIEASQQEREQLAARIAWIERHKDLEIRDQRAHARFIPRRPLRSSPSWTDRKCLAS
jgi:uncharacterized protein (TIGR02453 family)